MLNYRARQVLALLHASPLVEFLTDLDPRISYGFDDQPFLSAANYAPQIIPMTATESDRLSVTGTPEAPDVSGKMKFQFRVDILTPETVRTDRQQPVPFTASIDDFAIASGGWSNRIALSDSGYSFALNTTNVGATWAVEFLNRPQYDLGEIAASLENVGEPILLELFGTASDEPYKTFRNLWFDAKDLPFKLGGILLALIYRSDERRARNA